MQDSGINFRANQAIDGFTPAERSHTTPAAPVISLAEMKKQKMVRHSFAHGLLNAYELVEALPEDEFTAA